MDKENFISVSNKMKLKNGEFFPFPIYLVIDKKYKKICKINKTISFKYKKNKVCDFHIEDFFKFSQKQKREIGKKLFKTNNNQHPGYSFFKHENGIFVSGKIINFNHKVLNLINFSKPKDIKKKIRKLEKIVGFHTRNIPHKGHEWIHSYGVKKCKNILIQPIVGHFKNGEYSEQAVIDSNKYLVKKQNLINIKNKSKNRFFFSFINIYPKYAGPREALLHALIRKNYGCTHFLVGRDHAGYKKFYAKYDSQRLCVFMEKRLKIKIIKFKSPKMCKYCKNITNKKCKCFKSKNKNSLIDINGSTIRKLIEERKQIPDYLINNKLITKLRVKEILH